MPPPVSLFPPTPALGFTNGGPLQVAVSAAVTELVAARKGAIPFSLAIIDLGDGGSTGTLKWGAHKPDEIHYVASAVKVAAMLAAYALRDMARRFWTVQKVAAVGVAAAGAAGKAAAQLPGIGKAIAAPLNKVGALKESPLFAALRAQMDPAIDSGSPALLAAVQRTHRVPHYEQVLAASPAGSSTTPDFTGAFRTAMQQMIVPSDNGAAGQVIRGVGYGYLNGMLLSAGLFVPKTPSGVWLAGDFVSQYPYVRINSANDAGVAQAGSALGMAQMLALIVNRAYIDAGACGEMRKLLAEAVHGVDVPFLTRDTLDAKMRIPLAKLTHAKLGFGPLKKGGNVCSEIFRIEGLGRAGKAYAVAFQNLNELSSSLDDVAFMLRRALEIYEK